MKKTLIMLAVYGLNITNIQAQKLQKESVTERSVLSIVVDYLSVASDYHWFYESKGVIEMSKCVTDTADIYSFRAYIDDRFLDNPPTKYAFAFNTIILIYEVDNQCKQIKNTLSQQDIDKLLDEIGDRIYERPKAKGHWDEYRTSDTTIERRRIENSKTIHVGGGTHVRYFMKKDGTFRRLISV
jgi:hypothetical protein